MKNIMTKSSIIAVVMFLYLFSVSFACAKQPKQQQGQIQGQVQGQLQGQVQGQTSSNSNSNSNVNKNTNENTNNNTQANKQINSQSVKIENPDEITQTIRKAPGVTHINTELPTYIGPYPVNWNDQTTTSLTFLLSAVRDFTVNKKTFFILYNLNYTKSSVSIVTDNDNGHPKYVKVLTSVKELKGLDFTVMATVVAHGNRKNTSMDCFYQAMVDTSESGGNVFLLLSSDSDPGVHSSTIGLGGSGAGNFSQDGTEAFSAGTATGFSSNTGGPVSNPYIHGISLRMSKETLKKVVYIGMLN